jgi:hypothetical protein
VNTNSFEDETGLRASCLSRRRERRRRRKKKKKKKKGGE